MSAGCEIKGLLIDLDGVIYNQDTVIPGAAETIQYLTDKKIPFRFITNTTMKSRSGLSAKLQFMGIHCRPEHIFSSVYAGVLYLGNIAAERPYFLLTPDAQSEFSQAHHDENADVVVVGDLGLENFFTPLNRAFQHLLNGAKLVALQKNRFWLSNFGYTLDAGAFVAMLEFAAGVQAVVLGKPNKAFFDLAVQSIDIPPQNLLMIGDDIESDMRGAQQSGLMTMLVETGKYRPGDENQLQKAPDFRLPSLRFVREIIG